MLGFDLNSFGVIRDRVLKARQRQLRRFKNEKIFANAAMTPRMIRAHCQIDAVSERMLENMIYQEANEDEKGGVPGLQQLVLRREPAGDWNETTDRRLPVFFEGAEWSALFYDVLRCPTAHPFMPNDNLEEWNQKQKIKFQAAIPDFPMLGRIWDTYIDVNYEPDEVNQLRDECLRVKAMTTDAIAGRGLDKLIHACDDAVKYSLDLQLVSD